MSRHTHKPFVRVIYLSLAVFVLLAGSVLGQGAAPDRPQQPTLVPPAVLNRLKLANDGPCKGLYEIEGLGLCTQGFDPPPPDLNLAPVPPVDFSKQTASVTAVCDGDGVSGNRVQVIYAHPPGTDRYSQYLSSFQQWMADMDTIFSASAAETGGTRHVRFVHDAGCKPVVLNVQVADQATINNPLDMWNDLSSQGYNRIDRKYVVFAETSAYSLGIGTIYPDDQPGAGNYNNRGPSYTSTPINLWGGSNPAHELMHNLGAVQASSPNSTGAYHCTDEYDRMCYTDSSGLPMRYVCTDPSHEQRFDCGHDDYYHTNPAPGSYLTTHWNTANNSFLIGAEAFVKTWTGATSTDWSVAGNWSPSGKPSSGEDCLIPAGAPRYPIINNWSAANCAGTLTVEHGARITDGTFGGLRADVAVISGTVDVLNGSYFDANSAITVSPGGRLLLQNGDTGMMFYDDGGALTVAGTVEVTGTFPIYADEWAGSAHLVINHGGTVSITDSGYLTVTGNVIINRGGLLDIFESGVLAVTGGGAITNNGALRETRDVPQGATTAFLSWSGLYYGMDITLGAGSDMGPTSVEIRGNQLCPEALLTLGRTVGRCYHISPTTSVTATVKFYYRSAEENVNPTPNAYHFNGSTWDGLSSTRGGSGETMWVQAVGVSSFSPFALKDPGIPTYLGWLPLILRDSNR